jgi:protein-S-isoprenylcysteine O-methyltransferase Ste14
MPSLELKIPPPIVALFVALAMWSVRLLAPSSSAAPVRVAAAVILVLVAVAFSVSGVLAFGKAKTTKNPMKPEDASSLVVTGVYKITRNPMYLGLCFLLLAWALFLWSPWALLGPLAFVAYISRFQIAPEERILATLFGAEYSAYKARVRRWL